MLVHGDIETEKVQREKTDRMGRMKRQAEGGVANSSSWDMMGSY